MTMFNSSTSLNMLYFFALVNRIFNKMFMPPSSASTIHHFGVRIEFHTLKSGKRLRRKISFILISVLLLNSLFCLYPRYHLLRWLSDTRTHISRYSLALSLPTYLPTYLLSISFKSKPHVSRQTCTSALSHVVTPRML